MNGLHIHVGRKYSRQFHSGAQTEQPNSGRKDLNVAQKGGTMTIPEHSARNRMEFTAMVEIDGT